MTYSEKDGAFTQRLLELGSNLAASMLFFSTSALAAMQR
jgi:hypothetical protein